jgi:hypothetical protein
MNALTTRSEMPSAGYSGQGDVTIELAKMLALVAPSSMTAEQQEMWLRAAIDALDDIRADEVRHVSAEVRRSVTRHNQIVPEISRLVAERRKERAESLRRSAIPNTPMPPLRPQVEQGPLSQEEISAMPKWLRDMGLRVGFLTQRDGRIADSGRAA